MRNGAAWIGDISVLVVDEIHLLNDPNRGPTLEMTITKLRKLNPGMQIIGLSATVANGPELADWLDAELVTSEWRPISLREGVICNGKLEQYVVEADARLVVEGLIEWALAVARRFCRWRPWAAMWFGQRCRWSLLRFATARRCRDRDERGPGGGGSS